MPTFVGTQWLLMNRSADPNPDPAAGSYGVAELAATLGLSRQAVQARVQRGSIRATKVGGVWRIPAVVVAALLQGEHTKAVVSGGVTVLPRVVPPEVDDPLASSALERRLTELAAVVEDQAREFRETLAELRRAMVAKDDEMQELRADRARLRRAVSALVADEALGS